MTLIAFFKWVFAFFGVLQWPAQAQVVEEFTLSEKLNEISGLELLNDSTLIGFNDGGNKSEVYLLNLKGEIIKSVDVLDTKNHDWEDIARDDEFVYIGDIGNNLNKRDNLSIVRLRIADILTKKEVKPEEITFKYADQNAFPPKDDSLFYDAEGMIVYKDSIWIFTKDRSVPFTGISRVYKIPTTPGAHTVAPSMEIPIGLTGWWADGITAADVFEDRVYLLTYNRIIAKDIKEGVLVDAYEYEFPGTTQRESIVVLNEDAIFVADEHNPIVGEVKMYKVRTQRDK